MGESRFVMLHNKLKQLICRSQCSAEAHITLCTPALNRSSAWRAQQKASLSACGKNDLLSVGKIFCAFASECTELHECGRCIFVLDWTSECTEMHDCFRYIVHVVTCGIFPNQQRTKGLPIKYCSTIHAASDASKALHFVLRLSKFA